MMQSARTIHPKGNLSHAVLEVEVKVDSFLALFRTLKMPMDLSKQALVGEHDQRISDSGRNRLGRLNRRDTSVKQWKGDVSSGRCSSGATPPKPFNAASH